MKNKSIRRKFLSVATVAIMGISFTIVPSYATAEQPHKIQEKSINKNFSNEARGIQKYEDILTEALNIYGQHLDSKRKYRHTHKPLYFTTKFHYNSVTADGSPIIKDSSSMFIGKTTLTNNSDKEQTLSTNSFTKTISHSVTTSTTNGFKTGFKSSGEISMPIGKMSMEVSLEYNFSNTNSQTKSEQYAYTATPQNIKVPANSSVEVVVMLNKVKAEGNVNLLSRISGKFDPFINHSYYPAPGEKSGKAYVHTANYGETVKYAKYFAKLPCLSVNSDDSVNLMGKGTYEAEVGTEFSVTVNPINQKNRSTGEGYSFKVKPKIQKVEK